MWSLLPGICSDVGKAVERQDSFIVGGCPSEWGVAVESRAAGVTWLHWSQARSER
jgi:hypothetical protein